MARAGSEKVATAVQDFTVLPLQLAAQPSFRQDATHYLYLRANTPRVPTETTPREIFLVNVPVDATMAHVRKLFAEHLGGARVESVVFEHSALASGAGSPPLAPSRKRKRDAGDSDEGTEGEESAAAAAVAAAAAAPLPATWDRGLQRAGGTAVARCVDRASAELVLREAQRAARSRRRVPWGGGGDEGIAAPPLGRARYAAHARRRFPDPDELQQAVDAFMAAFAAREEAQAQAQALRRTEPDADGFVLVARGGRTGPARAEAAQAKAAELQTRADKRVKDDFYRFQVREKKKEEARDLVRAFERDQRKVQDLKRRKGRIRPE